MSYVILAPFDSHGDRVRTQAVKCFTDLVKVISVSSIGSRPAFRPVIVIVPLPVRSGRDCNQTAGRALMNPAPVACSRVAGTPGR